MDEDNVAHIARHHVHPDEVEELAFDDEPWIRKGRGGKAMARVVTAMDMDEKSRRLYRKRRTSS